MPTTPDASQLEAVMRYHERTKHHFNRFAPGPGGLDWANQPDPFRRYAEAPLTRLPILKAEEEPRSPRYDSLYSPGAVASVPVSVRALSRLLEYALALSAWKQAGGTRWALRVNPSSGNLHPTEGCVLIGGIAELGGTRGLFHYCPAEPGLELEGVRELARQRWYGKANRLSPQDPVPWEIIDTVSAASRKP